MFRIYSGSQILHNPMSDITALSVKLAEELNTHGSLDMTLPSGRSVSARMPVDVYDDDGLIWRGRVVSYEKGLNYKREVHCEGMLAALCDTVIEPFVFRGRPDDVGNVKGLFHRFIDLHNSQLAQNDPRRFTVGSITVTDPNNYIRRSSEHALTTWEAIQTRLLDTLGGYVYLSGENLNVINYVADFNSASDQTIHFGENIIDLMQVDDAASIVTCVYAYGAENDSESPEPEPEPTLNGYSTWNGNRVHLASPGYKTYPTAISKWGYIYGTEVFDDVTTVEYLDNVAYAWLVNNYREHVTSLEVTAADLSLIDPTIDKLNVGDYVRVLCEPMSLDVLMLCVRKESDLIDMSQTRISIGKCPVKLTSIVGGGG